MTSLLTFLAGAAVPTIIWLFWPENKKITYLRGVVAAAEDAKNCNSEAAFDYYIDCSYAGLDQNEFDKGYRDALRGIKNNFGRELR